MQNESTKLLADYLAEQPRCDNCGQIIIPGMSRIVGGQAEEGEMFCSTFCYREHVERGCPFETPGATYRNAEWYASHIRQQEREKCANKVEAIDPTSDTLKRIAAAIREQK